MTHATRNRTSVLAAHSASSRPSLHGRWTAEVVRRLEQDGRRLDDVSVVAELREQSMSDEAKLIQRARQLAVAEGVQPPALPWHGARQGLSWLVVLLLLLSGIGSAVAVLGGGEQPVNIVWTVLALLGLPSLSLLLWLGSLGWRPRSGPSLGRWAVWGQLRWWGGSRAALWLQALQGLSQRSDWLKWWFAVLSHAVWASLLGGVLIGLLLALALRSYGFVWATTILPAAVFADLVQALGWLPSQLGFAAPARDTVLASGAVPLLADAVRRAWSSWLIGAVLVYGLAPRLLALAFSAWRLRRALVGARLDLELPYYRQLCRRLNPLSRRIGVIDAQAVPLPVFRLGQAEAGQARRGLLIGYELGPDLSWPPPWAGAEDAGLIDGREQRHALLDALRAQPARQALIAVDARQSPDRGALSFIAELSPHLADLAVWLHGQPASEREQAWREALVELGLPVEQVATDLAALNAWWRPQAHA